MRDRRKYLKAALAGMTGIFFANIVSGFLFFGIGRSILFDPAHQSQKVIAVMNTMEPLPLMRTDIGLYMFLALFIGIIHGIVFLYIRDSLPDNILRAGLSYGAILWGLMALYFEFQAPFNMLREPVPLLALELFFWIIVAGVEGIIISYTFSKI